MTILVLANTFWNIFNFRLDLINELKKSNFDIILAAPFDEYEMILKNKGFNTFVINFDQKGVNPIDDLFLFFSFVKLFNRAQPSLILSYTIKPNIYGSIASRLQKISVINNITGLGYTFIKGGVLKRIVIFLYKIALSNSKIIFFQNSFDKEITFGLSLLSELSLMPLLKSHKK